MVVYVHTVESRLILILIRGTFKQQNIPLKCCHALDQKVYEQGVVQFSKYLLHVPVDQRVAKLQAVKGGGLKQILPFSLHACSSVSIPS